MRYVTYDSGTGPRVGRLDGNDLLDLAFAGTMVEFIEAGAPRAVERRVSSEFRLLAPLVPRSLRDFLQFKGHLDNALVRLGREVPDEFFTVPAYYKGMPETVIGPDEVVPWPSYTEKLDHELELAAIVGRPGRDISVNDAAHHIFGYTIWNDMSARDVQVRELPLGLGPAKAKDWDGSNVLGPCILTSDEFPDDGLAMSVRVNGETWGTDNSSNMQHGFPELVAYCSQAQVLRPGEVLGSGTAAGGSGLELDRWLEPGDVIELEVEKIGILRNVVGNKRSAP